MPRVWEEPCAQREEGVRRVVDVTQTVGNPIQATWKVDPTSHPMMHPWKDAKGNSTDGSWTSVNCDACVNLATNRGGNARSRGKDST
mmetsp:Transcript_233/g.1844  ORF Transcript_233/g.1844 Transcript_233/m.1844 type:complete len:87 (-) Transcript_233:1555-1815(-)